MLFIPLFRLPHRIYRHRLSKEEDNFETPTSDNGKVNQWIDNAMREDYLWNDDLPGKSSLDFEASPETFFTSLLSSKDGKN